MWGCKTSFTVQCVPGASNYSADYLSRLVDMDDSQPDGSEELDEEEGVSVCEVTEGSIGEEEWLTELQNDVTLCKIRDIFSLGTRCKAQLKDWVGVWEKIVDELAVDKEFLLRGTRVIPPEKLR